MLVILAAATIAAGYGLTAAVRVAAFAALDQPSERSLHTRPVPRVGGVAFITVGAMATAIAGAGGMVSFDGALVAPIAAATALVFVASGLEDVRGLPAWIRFVLQTLAAVIVVFALMATYPPSSTLVPAAVFGGVAVFMTVWSANLFNFMDGSDGLAGVMAIIGLSALAIVARVAGAGDVFIICVLISAATLGFLFVNAPPARVFMGDAGSVTLGFVAAVLSLTLVFRDDVPVVVPGIIFLPFLLDATVTLLTRALRREPVWLPHRRHWYQRLVLAGWSHASVLRYYGALMVAAGAAGVAAQTGLHRWVAATFALALHAAVPVVVRVAERRARQPARSIRGSAER